MNKEPINPALEITASEAARQLKTTDKTLRSWTGPNNRISARRIDATHLAYKIEDVARLAEELAREKAESGQEASILLVQAIERIEALETRLAVAEKKIADLEARPRTRLANAAQRETEKNREKPSMIDLLPAGAILATEFAEQHNVNARTFKDHINIGLGYDRDKPPVQSIDHPSRAGQKIRYILPEDKARVLEYWRRHKVAYTQPE